MHTAPFRPVVDPDPAPLRGAPSDARDQLLLLWRHRAVLVVLAVLLGAAGAAFSLLRTRQFEAAATVSVSSARLADQTPGRVPPDTFVPLMTSPAVAVKVIDELHLAGISPQALLSNVVTVRSVPDSSLIKVVARMGEAESAAKVANTFAGHAVAAAMRASQIDVATIEDQLERMRDEAATRLRAAEKAYDDFRVSARVEMLEREVDTLVTQRGELMEVTVQLESERARLTRLEGELTRHDRVTSLKQSILEDPALSETARGATAPPRDLLAVQMTKETSNAVFEKLDEEAAKARAQVASLEQQRIRLAQAAGLNGDQLSKFTQLYERQSMLDRLNTERDIARQSYEDVAAKFQGTRLAAVGRTPQLLVVDPAIVPDEPLGRYLTRNVLLGIMSGLLLGCVALLLRQALTGPAGA